MHALETVLLFMKTINEHKPDQLAELMTEDHVFIDSLGNLVRGREKMRHSWSGYYGFCPDHWVSHEEIFQKGDKVAVFGSAGGTIADHGRLLPENRWRASAAWLAVAANGLVKEWRVYAHNKQVYDIVSRRTAK